MSSVGASRAGYLGKLVWPEWAPYPGRLDALWRYLLVSTLVLVISLTLQIPMLGISLVVVFFTAAENATLTRSAAWLSAIGHATAIASALLLFVFTLDNPMLRTVGAALILFLSIYFMRVSRLGAIGAFNALVVCMALTMLDTLNDPEAITRALLWMWVATLYPTLLTALVNGLLLPLHPRRNLQGELLRQLGDVAEQLEARRTHAAPPVLGLASIGAGALALHRHLAFSTRTGKAFRRDRGSQLMLIHTVDRLRTAAVHLSRLPASELSPEQRAWSGRLQEACRSLGRSLASGEPFRVDIPLMAEGLGNGEIDTALQEMGHALNAWAEAETLPPFAGTAAQRPLVAPDWASNPAYFKLALKTVLATMTCYVFQNAVQWPGISTSTITCLIMALPSLGASSHKGLLRITGCLLGSLVTLFMAVFLVPHLENLTGLLAVTLPIIALGGWIAGGPARTRYVGAQFILAFSLAMFGHFGPGADLNQIRNRMMGILLGVLVSLLFHTLLWPEREGAELWILLAKLVRSIAGLSRAGQGFDAEPLKLKAIAEARRRGWSLLAANREMESRVALEPGWQYPHAAVTQDLQTWFAQAQEALYSVNWLQTLLHHAGPNLPETLVDACERFRTESAERLDQLADHLERPADGREPISLAASLEAVERHGAQARAEATATRRIDELVAAVHAIHERIHQLSSHFSDHAPQPAGTR